MSKFRYMSVFLAITFVISGLISFPNNAFACSCAFDLSVMEERDRNDAVFEGTASVVKKPFSPFSRSSASKVKTMFQVNEVWKGKVAPTIEVTSASSGASCGFEFLEGQRYLVYARTTGDTLDVSLCSRTALYSAAEQDLIELGSGSIPPNPTQAQSNQSDQIWWVAGTVFITGSLAAIWIIVFQKGKRFKSKI